MRSSVDQNQRTFRRVHIPIDFLLHLAGKHNSIPGTLAFTHAIYLIKNGHLRFPDPIYSLP